MFYRIVIRSFYYLFSIFYSYRVYGISKTYPGAAIIAANHASFSDPLIIGASWPDDLNYLARSTLFNHYFMRLILIGLNTHPVSGTAQDLTSFKTIGRLLGEGKKVVIFPEGVRTDDGELKTVKTGVAMLAMRAKCPIIPTYIAGTFELWPRSRRWPRLHGRIGCVFGSPIDVQPYLEMDKKKGQLLLTEKVQESIEHLRDWYQDGAKGKIPS